MSFCPRCGKELRGDDRFCPGCGAPVIREADTENTDGQQGTGERGDAGKPERKKAAVIGAAAVVIVAAAALFIWNMVSSGGGKDRTQYVNYANDKVCFSLDYPEGYLVTEPDDNNVLITDGEEADLQVSVEYAFHTLADCAIYDAKDFAEQAEKDGKVLTDWLGTDKAQIGDCVQSKLGGRDCYEYDFELEVDGSPRTGKLYILDSDGDFGCYSYMQAVNESAKKAELFKKQCDTMEDSFKVTGACHAEGYGIYEYDSLKFLLRDEAAGEVEESGGDIVIYPAEGIYSEGSIRIEESVFEEKDRNTAEALEGCCGYYFSYKDRAKYLSGPTEIGYGRYPYTCVQLEYYDKGQKYTVYETVFVHDGKYWEITMKCTDEYYDTVSAALSDIFFSLKFTDGAEEAQAVPAEAAGADMSTGGSAVQDIIEEIEKQPGYNGKVTWEPLAAEGDFNGDGTLEFLAVYEIKNDDTFEVMYELWSLQDKEPERLKREVLFREVGGNYGIVGIVKKGDIPYLAVQKKEPAGEIFNDYSIYFPWKETEKAPGEEAVYMESHGTYGEEEKGKYILGDATVGKSEFDARKEEFSDWIYKVDLSQGSGNGGVKQLEEFKH